MESAFFRLDTDGGVYVSGGLLTSSCHRVLSGGVYEIIGGGL